MAGERKTARSFENGSVTLAPSGLERFDERGRLLYSSAGEGDALEGSSPLTTSPFGAS